MKQKLAFKRRLGLAPKSIENLQYKDGTPACAADSCPDLWELANGDFAIIGTKRTSELKDLLPESANCGPEEEIVIIPRAILTLAKKDIPED